MTVSKLSGIIGFIVLVSGSTTAIITSFETKANAEAQRNLIAEDRETGDLWTRLELIDIKIQRYKDLADVRSLTESEGIELRSLEAERQVILERLADKA